MMNEQKIAIQNFQMNLHPAMHVVAVKYHFSTIKFKVYPPCSSHSGTELHETYIYVGGKNLDVYRIQAIDIIFQIWEHAQKSKIFLPNKFSNPVKDSFQLFE